MVAIAPIFIMRLIKSAALTDIFCANSATVVASEILTSRTTGAVGIEKPCLFSAGLASLCLRDLPRRRRPSSSSPCEANLVSVRFEVRFLLSAPLRSLRPLRSSSDFLRAGSLRSLSLFGAAFSTTGAGAGSGLASAWGSTVGSGSLAASTSGVGSATGSAVCSTLAVSATAGAAASAALASASA